MPMRQWFPNAVTTPRRNDVPWDFVTAAHYYCNINNTKSHELRVPLQELLKPGIELHSNLGKPNILDIFRPSGGTPFLSTSSLMAF